MPSVRHPLRVRYSECDPQGVVFNANYLAYNDVAAIELWRASIGGYDELPRTHDADVLIAEINIRYLAPLHFDDEIEIEIGVRDLGNTSMKLGVRIWRGSEQTTEIATRSVFIEPGGNVKTPMPESVREQLEGFLIDW